MAIRQEHIVINDQVQPMYTNPPEAVEDGRVHVWGIINEIGPCYILATYPDSYKNKYKAVRKQEFLQTWSIYHEQYTQVKQAG